MSKSKLKDTYTEAFEEYQDKQYLPGYYVGGKMHPALKAKTKAGGYAMLIGGIFLLVFYSFQLIGNLTLENIGWIIPMAVAIMLITVGIKFIKNNSRK
jgi:hypothetical protein